jgi:two-component system sensor histidine kinase RegB
MSVESAQIAAGPSAAIVAARAPGRDEGDERGRLNLSWLVQLHWWAILGQIVVIAGAAVLTTIGLPVPTLLALIGLEAVGNVVLGAWARRARVTDAAIAAVMLVDAVVLTVLLDLTGGASNPFSTLYLVNVALAAMLLPSAWAWVLMVVSLVSFASLFLHEATTVPAHHIRTHMEPGELMAAHLRGMWISFALAAVFIVFFVRRVASALGERERELQLARAQAQRREKLASLATLAAGAAHELSTPLSTIAVVAKELQRTLSGSVSAEVGADLQLVREQVGRCRDILDRMSVNAGENVGEPFARFTVTEWVTAALEGLRGRERVQVETGPGSDGAELLGPPRALADALRGLLKNALQASPPAGGPVRLRTDARNGRVRMTVLDRGAGMDPDVLSRAGEPFFTTKGPGEGMGLGLFLTRALAEQLGGELAITSTPAAGTEARIDLPVACAAERRTP